MTYGTGESGIKSMSKDEYFKECDPELVTTFFCSYYGIVEPALKENPSRNSGSWRGRYFPSKKLMTFNKRHAGLIIHELAHHVAHSLGRNGTGHHNPQYWQILQEMHDLWS